MTDVGDGLQPHYDASFSYMLLKLYLALQQCVGSSLGSELVHPNHTIEVFIVRIGFWGLLMLWKNYLGTITENCFQHNV